MFSSPRLSWNRSRGPRSRAICDRWACVAYLTLDAMKVPHRGVLLQTRKDY